MNLPPLPLVVLDTETTGFVPRVHHVIEFASAIVRNGKIEKEYEQLFTAKEVPPHVEVLTRIKTAALQGKPSFDERRAEVMAHIPEDALVVGQNVLFDIGMLKGEGIDLSERPWIDTSMLASLVFPELQSYSLGYLSRVLKLNHNPPHRALGDVHATLQLLSACWERLLELPENARNAAIEIMSKSTAGYRTLFASLPASSHKKNPAWMKTEQMERAEGTDVLLILESPSKGDIDLVEEPLDSSYLHSIVRGSVKDNQKRWIAVKNLRAALRRVPADLQKAMADGKIRAIYPPQSILDSAAKDTFLAQDIFTADEATLALKLQWYKPNRREDLPLHGGEEAVWNGKIACTDTAPAYISQFSDAPPLVIVDHRELLRFLITPDHPASKCLQEGTHVVIDDASMLEDTATKAYGWYCDIDHVRAGAEGNPILTKFTDTLQLWIEKTRRGQDIRFLAPSDVRSSDTQGLCQQLDHLLSQELPAQTKQALQKLRLLLEPENLSGRIVWIEQRQNGSQQLQSVPERIGTFLSQSLFKRHPVSLFIPSHAGEMLPEILPHGSKSRIQNIPQASKLLNALPLSFDAEPTIESLLSSPPSGKTIILLPSKGTIENLYVKYAEALEAAGTTFICQGLNGGQGRMQSEFIAAPAPAIWLLTPWMFEGMELPPGSTDHLIIKSLPFDHPSNPITQQRSLHYSDAFVDYCLPRLQHRLFRLLRTFCRFKTSLGDVRILDERLFTKKYGKDVRDYLGHFAADASTLATEMAAPKKVVPEKKTKGKEGQLSLF